MGERGKRLENGGRASRAGTRSCHPRTRLEMKLFAQRPQNAVVVPQAGRTVGTGRRYTFVHRALFISCVFFFPECLSVINIGAHAWYTPSDGKNIITGDQSK